MFEKSENRIMAVYEYVTRRPTKRELLYLAAGFVITVISSTIKITPSDIVKLINDPLTGDNQTCIHDIQVLNNNSSASVEIYTDGKDLNGNPNLQTHRLDLVKSEFDGKRVEGMTLNSAVNRVNTIYTLKQNPNGVYLDVCLK